MIKCRYKYEVEKYHSDKKEWIKEYRFYYIKVEIEKDNNVFRNMKFIEELTIGI